MSSNEVNIELNSFSISSFITACNAWEVDLSNCMHANADYDQILFAILMIQETKTAK